MLPTLNQGSTGAAVSALQGQLNLVATGSPLSIDGIFGPLTGSKVRDFQRSRGLVADAIVGPQSWTALAAIRPAVRAGSAPKLCDNANPANPGKAGVIASALRGAAAGGGGFSLAPGRSAFGVADGGGGSGGSGTAAASLSVGGVTMTSIVGSSHEAPARAVYGASLIYDRIFFTNQSGAEKRPFTLAVPCPPFVVASLPFGGFIQVLNLGPAPDAKTVIHELGHAWQSQHHATATAYMANCVACQGAAVAANTFIGEKLDPSVKANDDWPVNFPMSAYAYRPGAAFGTYGGEQIAEQIENNEVPIRSHVSGQAAGGQDPDNAKSLGLTNVRIEDLRASGVKV